MAKKAAKMELDTSDLRIFGKIFTTKDEDSFAGEFLRFSDEESDRLLCETELGSDTLRFGIYESDSAERIVEVQNKFNEVLSRNICSHMQEYLLKKNGKVKRWVESRPPWKITLKSSDRSFYYDYFGCSYKVKGKEIAHSSKHIYQNHYHYPERDPNLLVKKLEKKFYDEHNRAEFLKEESKAFEIAKSGVDTAKKKDEVITGAKARLILVFLLILLAGLATACGFGLPLDLVAAANLLTGFLSKAWNTLPAVLNFIVCALLAIPLYVIVIALMFADTAGTIIFAAGQLGTVWLTVFLVVLWGAVLVASVFLGVHCAFWKSPLPDAQKAYSAAREALDKKDAEYDRMQEEFRATDNYRRAQERDKKETEEDQLKKAENERFAECWQRAWFEAVQEGLRLD